MKNFFLSNQFVSFSTYIKYKSTCEKLPKAFFKLQILTIFLLSLSSKYILATTSNNISSIFKLPLPFINSHNTNNINGKNYNNHWQYLQENFNWHNNYNTDLERPEVYKQLDYLKQYPNYMVEITNNAEPYIYYLSKQIHDRKLPAELALLPIVESSFNPRAYSSAGAAGIWQMMPNTAKYYGVNQNWWYDGRRDIVTSTNAALDHIERLYYNLNKDWLLTIAAYNAGAGAVKRSIRLNQKYNKKTDFWSLKLPRETKKYIPKFLAFIKVINNPEKYNQQLPYIPHESYFDIVSLDSQIDLKLAAKLSDLNIKEIHNLNPGFNHFATAPNGPHHLVLPIYNSLIFNNNLSSIDINKLVRYQRYTIRKGDTLSGISKKFKTTIRVIKQLNNMASNRININHKLIIPVRKANLIA